MTQTEQTKPVGRIVVELTMSVEEARQVIWQGRGPRESMGKLFDSKQIDSGDLAWAVDQAFTPKVREAARTLLASWLGQPATLETTLRYGPQVIEGSHYLEEREFDSVTMFFMYVGVAFGVGIFVLSTVIPWYLLVAFRALVLRSYDLLSVVALLTLPVAVWIGWDLVRRIRQHLDEYRSFRIGREGEDAVVEKLRTALDNRWTIFRNLHLPGHDDDLDIVLVGPSVISAIEVKALRGSFRVQGKRWEIQTKSGWRAFRENPSLEIEKHAAELREFLERRGVTIRWVGSAIVMTEPQPNSDFGDSEVAIWLLPKIEERVVALTSRKPPTEAAIAQIVTLLKRLAEEQIDKEEAKYGRSR